MSRKLSILCEWVLILCYTYVNYGQLLGMPRKKKDIVTNFWCVSSGHSYKIQTKLNGKKLKRFIKCYIQAQLEIQLLQSAQAHELEGTDQKVRKRSNSHEEQRVRK